MVRRDGVESLHFIHSGKIRPEIPKMESGYAASLTISRAEDRAMTPYPTPW